MTNRSLKAIRRFSFRTIASKLGIAIVPQANLMQLTEKSKNFDRIATDVAFFRSLSQEQVESAIEHISHSKAQLRQDLFVLSELKYKKNGFYVEFGATDGISFSNTYLLESQFEWSGILAEPSRLFYRKLVRNRSKACIVEKCIWDKSGELLEFNEVEIPELSTVHEYSDSDFHYDARKNSKRMYKVESLSLTDLLDRFAAPKTIDYLSIDTEGSEYRILSAFDFDRYQFRIITVEHNYSPQRQMINSLLVSKGYVRVKEEISEFDDWFIKPDLL